MLGLCINKKHDLSVSTKAYLLDQNDLLSNDVNLIFLGSWEYSEAKETSRSYKEKKTPPPSG